MKPEPQEINQALKNFHKLCGEAIEWLNTRGIVIRQIVIARQHAIIYLERKPYCELKHSHVLLREGTFAGEVVHVVAPLKGCSVYWREGLQ